KHMSRCSSTWSSPYSSLSRVDNVSILEEDQGGNMPRIFTPPRHLHHYIKGLSPPPSHSFIHTISYVKEKSREAPPLCILSLGSVRGRSAEKSRTCRPLFGFVPLRIRYIWSTYPGSSNW